MRYYAANLKEQIAFLSRDLAAVRQENAELRERVVEIKHSDLCRLSRIFNAAADLSGTQDYSINEWLKKQIALAKPASLSAQEPQRTSITETLMNPDEKRFWDAADRQADEPRKDPNTPSLADTSEAVEWDKKCK